MKERIIVWFNKYYIVRKETIISIVIIQHYIKTATINVMIYGKRNYRTLNYMVTIYSPKYHFHQRYYDIIVMSHHKW